MLGLLINPFLLLILLLSGAEHLLAEDSLLPTNGSYRLSLVRPKVNVVVYGDLKQSRDAGGSDTEQQIRQELSNTWGASFAWSIQFSEENNWPAAPVSRHSIPENAEPPHMADSRIDLLLEEDNGRWTISSRSWLALTQEWTSSPSVTIRSRKMLASRAAFAITQHSPQVSLVTDVEQDSVNGILLGGEISSPQFGSVGLTQGDLLEVVMLYYSREGKLRQRQTLSWTYLDVKERERGRIQCTIHSAFRSPIPQSRRRVEVMARRVTSDFEQTELHIQRRGRSVQDFPLTKVLISPWVFEEENDEEENKAEKKPFVSLITDRAGRVLLSQSELKEELQTSLVKVEVMSHETVVARVPYLLGSRKELELTVPDDSARVEASIRFDQLKTDLLRVTAKRATLMAAFKKLLDEPREEIQPARILEEIEKLPDRKTFKKQITLIRAGAEAELQELGNRVAARQVKTLADQTEALVDRYLDPEQVEELKQRWEATREGDGK